MKNPNVPPLARSEAREMLAYDHLEPAAAPTPTDTLGLSPADRAALGLSAPRTASLVPEMGGDAAKALADALAHGGAIGKTERRARK